MDSLLIADCIIGNHKSNIRFLKILNCIVPKTHVYFCIYDSTSKFLALQTKIIVQDYTYLRNECVLFLGLLAFYANRLV